MRTDLGPARPSVHAGLDDDGSQADVIVFVYGDAELACNAPFRSRAARHAANMHQYN